jgi:hypothetical protein
VGDVGIPVMVAVLGEEVVLSILHEGFWELGTALLRAAFGVFDSQLANLLSARKSQAGIYGTSTALWWIVAGAFVCFFGLAKLKLKG